MLIHAEMQWQLIESLKYEYYHIFHKHQLQFFLIHDIFMNTDSLISNSKLSEK